MWQEVPSTFWLNHDSKKQLKETKLKQLSHAPFLSRTLYHIPFGIQVSWLKQKEERQPASVSSFNLGNISSSTSKYTFADLPHSYGLFCLQKSRHGQKIFLISPQQLQKNLHIAHFQNKLTSIILVFWCCYSFSLLRPLFEDAALAAPCSSSLPLHPWSTFPGCCWTLALCCDSS